MNGLGKKAFRLAMKKYGFFLKKKNRVLGWLSGNVCDS